jgi:hypothetical protein
MELSVIIVNWNSSEYLKKCLRSLYSNLSNVEFEVIVVDNASYDGCGEMLRSEFPTVKFIQALKNLGFASANNLGGRHAHGPVLLFLNPDTEAKNRAIDRLYTQFQELPDPGVVGCRLLNSDGSLQTSCVQAFPTIPNQILDADLLRRWFPNSSLWGNAALFHEGGAPVEVEAVSGACMMMRREVFEDVGGFTPDYFMYGEDIDLCFKTRRAGFHNYHISAATVVHHGGGSSQKTDSNFSFVMMRVSVSRLLRRYRGGFYSNCYRLALTGTAIIRLISLGVVFPIWLIRGRAYRGDSAFEKWFAIISWGVGLEQWTRQYDVVGPSVND